MSGQPVLLGLAESLFMKLVLRLYGLPLVSGILGAVAGQALAQLRGFSPGMSDLTTIATALAGVALVLIFWNRTSKPDVNSSDIHMLEIPEARPACDPGMGNKRI